VPISEKTRDPLVGYHFALELESVTAGHFREVSGLGSEQQVIEYKAAVKKGGEVVTQKVPGTVKYPDITLKRGITDSMDLWAWREQVIEGKVNAARKNGSIVMFDQANGEVARWNFIDAWPSKITGPSLNAGGNDVAVEEIVITHEKLTRIK